MEFLNNAPESARNERAWRHWQAQHPKYGEEAKPCNVCGEHFSDSPARWFPFCGDSVCTCELSPEMVSK